HEMPVPSDRAGKVTPVDGLFARRRLIPRPQENRTECDDPAGDMDGMNRRKDVEKSRVGISLEVEPAIDKSKPDHDLRRNECRTERGRSYQELPAPVIFVGEQRRLRKVVRHAAA